MRNHLGISKLRRAIALALAGLGMAGATVSPAAAAEPGYDIIVIGGQSNAVGAGRSEYHDEMRSVRVDRRIFQLGRKIDNCLNHEGRIVPASDVLEHWGNCPSWGGIGFGMAFARRWASSPLSQGRDVLIVPGAYGGSTIQQWRETLWQALKEQIKTALATPGGRNRVVAFLWSQGESDLHVCELVPTIALCNYQPGGASVREQWRERTTALFQEFRTLFDPKAEAPILATGFVPAWTEVRFDKDPKNPCTSSDGITLDDPGCYGVTSVLDLKIAYEGELARLERAKTLPRFGYVPTAGLTSNGEEGAGLKPLVLPLHFTEAQIHFGSQGQINLGERLWQAYLRHQAP